MYRVNYELPVLILNDRRVGKHVRFGEMGEIGVVTRLWRYADGYDEFTVVLGNYCRLLARVTHFEVIGRHDDLLAEKGTVQWQNN